MEFKIEINKRIREGRSRGELWLKEAWIGPSFRWDVGLTDESFRQVAFTFTFGGDDNDLSLNVGIYWASFFIHFCDIFPRTWRKRSYDWSCRKAELLSRTSPSKVYSYELDPFDGRDIGVRIFGGSLWLNFWKNDVGWRGVDTPGFRNGKWSWGVLPWNGYGWGKTLHIQDLLIGDLEFEVSDSWEYSDNIVLQMPEGTYPGMIDVKKVRWNRRWWNGDWKYNFKIEIPDGVPHPGKGNASYNCGEDATYSISFCEELDEQLIHFYKYYFACKFKEKVVGYREKYAGTNWKPKNGWPEHCNAS